MANMFTNADYLLIGERIRKKREEKKLSQIELAKRLTAILPQPEEKSEEKSKEKYISYRTIGNWESGKTTKSLTIERLNALCKVLECDFHYLLLETDFSTKEIELCHDITGLSEYSSTVLIDEVRQSVVEKEVLDSIMQDKDFCKLLLQIHRYRSSYSRRIIIEDDANLYKPEFVTDYETVSTYIKRSSVEIFENILDRLYEAEKPQVVDSLVYTLVRNLICQVHETCHSELITNAYVNTDELNKDILQHFEGFIRSKQSEIKQHSPNNIIANYDPEYIISNIDALYNTICANSDYADTAITQS